MILNRAELRELADRWRACLQGVQCRVWLAQHRFAAAVPAFCASKPMINALVP